MFRYHGSSCRATPEVTSPSHNASVQRRAGRDGQARAGGGVVGSRRPAPPEWPPVPAGRAGGPEPGAALGGLGGVRVPGGGGRRLSVRTGLDLRAAYGAFVAVTHPVVDTR